MKNKTAGSHEFTRPIPSLYALSVSPFIANATQIFSPLTSTMLSHQAIVKNLNLVDGVKELVRSRLGLASVLLLRTEVLLDKGSVVRVKTEKDLLVAEGVLLLDTGTLGKSGTLGGVEDALDFGAVNQTGEVGLRNNVGRQKEVLLELRGLGGGSVDDVQCLEGSGGPDDETTEVTTRGELEEVQGVDIGCLNTGQVAETLDELSAVNLGVVDDQRTTTLAVATASELTLTGTELLGALGLQDILAGTDGSQDLESSGGLGSGRALEDGGVDDQGNLGNFRDGVTTSEEEGGDSGSSNGRGSSESPGFLLAILFLTDLSSFHSLLALVGLHVPLAPDLGRGKHATGSAHVTESSLTSTVCTTTGDTRNTGNGTTYIQY